MSGLLTINRQLAKLASIGPLITRVILGALMFWHGVDKFRTGIGNVGDMFEMWGVPIAGFSAGLVAVIEVVAGLGLIFGIATRLNAALLSLVLIGALIFVKLDGSLLGGSEVDFAYLAGLLSLLVIGPGAVSVDGAMNTDATSIDLRSRGALANA